MLMLSQLRARAGLLTGRCVERTRTTSESRSCKETLIFHTTALLMRVRGAPRAAKASRRKLEQRHVRRLEKRDTTSLNVRHRTRDWQQTDQCMSKRIL